MRYLQVDSLASGIRGEQDRAVGLLDEANLGQAPFGPEDRAVDDLDVGVRKELEESLLEVLQRSPVLCEDYDLPPLARLVVHLVAGEEIGESLPLGIDAGRAHRLCLGDEPVEEQDLGLELLECSSGGCHGGRVVLIRLGLFGAELVGVSGL